jgi:hypothetical protein
MAARFCPQCGQEISSVAKFCPHCGMNLVAGATAVGPPATRMDAAARGTRRLLLPLTVVVLVVLAVAVAVLANRLHQDSLLSSRTLPMPSAMPLTNTPTAPIPAAAPLTNAPSTPAPAAPPLTNAPSNGPGQLPPDVAAYVKFLQGIEERRVALSNDTSGAMAMLSTAHQMQDEQQEAQQEENTDPDAPSGSNPPTAAAGTSKISSGFTDYNAKWQTLVADFRSQSPPPACADLANHYYNFLIGYAKVISQLQVAVLNGNIGAAMSAQSAQSQINDQALQADASLAQLCAHYNAPKPFSIQPDGASSSLLGQ